MNYTQEDITVKPFDTMKQILSSSSCEDVLADLYVSPSEVPYQKDRYLKALNCFISQFGEGDVCFFSAPGRSELGGNHTDHQHGHVLAASIHQDVIAVVRKTDTNEIRLISEGYEMITISLDDLSNNPEEKETTTALVKGVLHGFVKNGLKIGGFEAYLTSDVLIGAGLSSSAAFETIIGTILSGLYNEDEVSAVEIAIIGQYAENEYFGKPCGLMDQMACSVGSLVHIDFKNPASPVVERISFDLAKMGYCLCVTDTKGSHANLTDDYAAIPAEMKVAASVLGKEYLADVTLEEVYNNLGKIREAGGDRAALRAIHFVEETSRAVLESNALKNDDLASFLSLITESGNSSYKYLQNTYTNQDVTNQEICIAIAMSEHLLGKRGACRVHGGGFAGTIQAFVPMDMVEQYKSGMESVFGKDSCHVLHIRKYGGVKVNL